MERDARPVWLPPIEARWLYYSTKLRIEAGQKGITLVKWEHNTLTLERQVGKKLLSEKCVFKAIQDPVEIETKMLPRVRQWMMEQKKERAPVMDDVRRMRVGG